ncbi:MAG: transglutaminase-like putative cysteine protease [Pseudohongiellaceae bacterium]|jgi:transglutaminase-like putative cysteine protease
MWLRTSCQLEFDLEIPTPFILMLRPRSGAQQWIASEQYKIAPTVPVVEFTDNYGNLCQRLVAPTGAFSVRTQAEVKIADGIDVAPGAEFIDIQQLPDSILGFLLPSRYCESDQFSDQARAITDGELMGYDQVAAIENWLRNNIQFVQDNSDWQVSATAVNTRQWGVCRDLSHLGIALCRSLSIPARLVVGYLHGLEPMDFHAWFEAYVGGRWYSFDATQASKNKAYVAIGYGRDAADVAIYNQFGPSSCPVTQQVRVEQIMNPSG